jgi:UDP:flavonoid glycosyltransferase YjiC (YdhE family)
VRVKPAATPEKIGQAVRMILETPEYRERARRLGQQIVRDAHQSPAVTVLESLARKARAS